MRHIKMMQYLMQHCALLKYAKGDHPGQPFAGRWYGWSRRGGRHASHISNRFHENEGRCIWPNHCHPSSPRSLSIPILSRFRFICGHNLYDPERFRRDNISYRCLESSQRNYCVMLKCLLVLDVLLQGYSGNIDVCSRKLRGHQADIDVPHVPRIDIIVAHAGPVERTITRQHRRGHRVQLDVQCAPNGEHLTDVGHSRNGSNAVRRVQRQTQGPRPHPQLVSNTKPQLLFQPLQRRPAELLRVGGERIRRFGDVGDHGGKFGDACCCF